MKPLSVRSLVRWGPVAILGGYPPLVVHLTATYHIHPSTWMWLALLHGLLGLAMWAGLTALDGLHWSAGVVGSMAAGGLGALHLWDHADGIHAWPAVGLAAVCGAGLVWGLLRVARPRLRPLPAVVVSLLSLLLFAAVTILAYRSQPLVRWQLLRQDRSIGTPAFYALSDPVRTVEKRHYALDEAPDAAPATRRARGQMGDLERRPHLVFILVDTLRADAFASHGASPPLMPELDAFSAKSMDFQDVIVNSGWTRPSVASFFTGLLGEDHGAMDRTDRLPEERTTLAERLKAEGYETQAFVTNWGACGGEVGFGQGFEQYRNLRVSEGAYMRGEAVSERVGSWLADRGRSSSEQPLFLYVHYLDPHTPYRSGGPPTPKSHSEAREAYDQELQYTDTHVAKLIRALGRALEGPTYILLTSDHGEQFGEHGARGHANFLYREVIHVPAILHTPDGHSGSVDASLEARDFYDLMVGLGSGDINDAQRWAKGAARDTRYSSMIVTTKHAPHRPYLEKVAMRLVERNGTELIWSAYGPTQEMYDLEKDPGEVHNLLLERPEQVKRLSAIMHQQVGGRSAPDPILPSKDTTEQLRALGYVE